MLDINTVGIDIAKTTFHIICLDKGGNQVLSKKVKRSEFERYVLKHIPAHSQIYMEACGTCHYWSQRFQELGYRIFLLKPSDVKPFCKNQQKNDEKDALAIARAGCDPTLKRVRIKNSSEQEICWLHKRRDQLIGSRIRLSNHLMGSLLEFGYCATRSKGKFAHHAKEEVDTCYAEGYISEFLYHEFCKVVEDIESLLEREREIQKGIESLNRESERAILLQTIKGIGTINASILSVAPYESYASGRDFASSLGLVPRQHSTGGKTTLGSITKRGDRYVRKMLIQGARTIGIRARIDKDPKDRLVIWAQKLLARMTMNKACVAIANKLARICHACVTNGVCYDGQQQAQTN